MGINFLSLVLAVISLFLFAKKEDKTRTGELSSSFLFFVVSFFRVAERTCASVSLFLFLYLLLRVCRSPSLVL